MNDQKRPPLAYDEYAQVSSDFLRDLIATCKTYEAQGLLPVEVMGELMLLAGTYAASFKLNRAKFADLAHKTYYRVLETVTELEMQDVFDKDFTSVLRKDRPR